MSTTVTAPTLLLCFALVEPPSDDDELVQFIKDLGYSGQFQILWAIYHKLDVDFVVLLWEDFMFQADNRDISPSRKEYMPYPRFTKLIISYFISKDKTISIRNMINLHIIRDDSLLGTLKHVSKTEDHQIYGALIPVEIIDQDIQTFDEYHMYLAFATGEAIPKKARKFKTPSSPKQKTAPISSKEPSKKHAKKAETIKKSSRKTTGVVIRDTRDVLAPKQKAPSKETRGKGLDVLSEVAVPDKPKGKKISKDEGTGIKPGVPDVLKDQSDSENESWKILEMKRRMMMMIMMMTNKCSNNEQENVDEEETYEELYGDVNVNLEGAVHEEEGIRDEEIIDAIQKDATQERSYEQE
ncbi:hypothetical protein Tco_1568582 [Tanacetum coccineum]